MRRKTWEVRRAWAADRAANRNYGKSRFVLGLFRLCQWLRAAPGPISRVGYLIAAGAYTLIAQWVLGIELPPSTPVGGATVAAWSWSSRQPSHAYWRQRHVASRSDARQSHRSARLPHHRRRCRDRSRCGHHRCDHDRGRREDRAQLRRRPRRPTRRRRTFSFGQDPLLVELN